MDFWQTLKVVTRRWYVAIPSFIGAIIVAVLVYSSIPTHYVSTSVLVLTTPTTGATEQPASSEPNAVTNPLLNFDRGLSLSASILIQALSTPESGAAVGVVPNGPTTYEVDNGSTNPELLTTSPFIFIQGDSTDPQSAQDIVQAVSDRARVELSDRQQELDAPPSTFIGLHEVVAPTTPVPQRSGRLRAAGAALALALLAGLSASFAVESYAINRRKRATTRRGEPRLRVSDRELLDARR